MKVEEDNQSAAEPFPYRTAYRTVVNVCGQRSTKLCRVAEDTQECIAATSTSFLRTLLPAFES